MRVMPKSNDLIVVLHGNIIRIEIQMMLLLKHVSKQYRIHMTRLGQKNLDNLTRISGVQLHFLVDSLGGPPLHPLQKNSI